MSGNITKPVLCLMLAGLLFLAGCDEPVDKSTTAVSSNPTVSVTNIGEYDGCKMYEVSQYGNFAFYFVRCPHESTDAAWRTGGKVTHYYHVRTVTP